MTWKEVVKTAKYKWVVIEVIKAKSENGKRIIEDMNLLAEYESGGEALKDYAKRKKENKEKEFYVHDSTVNFLDIDEVKLD